MTGGTMRSRAVMMAALALGAIAPGMAQPTPMVRTLSSSRFIKSQFSGYAMPPQRWSYGGPHITMAQQQRASKKARNVRRNRKAQRGRK